MLIGKVKYFNKTKGWGFIVDSNGEDYFFNISNLRLGQKISLGDNVKFDVEQSHRGPSATNILKIDSK